jgi:transcriptional regulator with XRE-family HTH domain
MKEIGARITLKRKQAGLSQEKLADLLGVSRGSVGNYETSGNLPSIETLIKLAEILNTSVDFILRGLDLKDSKTDKILIKSLENQIEDKERLIRSQAKQIEDLLSDKEDLKQRLSEAEKERQTS